MAKKESLVQEVVNTGLNVMFTWRDVEFNIVVTPKPRMKEKGLKMDIRDIFPTSDDRPRARS